jgi:DNA segregation ATPase FtsK/SpoIIIE, S-DNA-T family
MANRLKSEQNKTVINEQPKERVSQNGKSKEKKEKTDSPSRSSTLFKDGRVIKIAGLLCLLFSIYLFVAFTSFLVTGAHDLSIVKGSGLGLIFDAKNNEVENWLGIIGALVSHLFIAKWFGVASYTFVFVFFIVGYKLLFKVSLLNLSRSLAYSLFFLIFISVLTGFILSFFNNQLPFIAGAYGIQSNLWLNTVLGKTGTGGLLTFAALTFLVIAYNIEFKSPIVKKEKSEDILEDELIPVEQNRRSLYDQAEYEATPEAVEFPVLNKPLDEDHMPSLKESAVDEESEARNQRSEITDLSSDLRLPTSDVELEALSSANHIELETQSDIRNSQSEIINDVPFETEIIEEKEAGEITSESLVKEFGEFDPTLELSSYKYPPLELLENYGSSKISVNTEELETNKNRIVETLGHYNIDIAKIKATIGPTVTLYEIVPAAGIRISKIKNLEDDIALSLSALGIRIIAPIPGKGTIGIEVPNMHPEMVSMRSVLASEKYQNAQMDLPVALGKTISNEVFIVDLAKMPHLLMAGATGQGKSVGINALLVSLLYKKHPSQIKFVMVDPKKVELTLFRTIERHFLAKLPGEGDAIITDTKKVIYTLNSLCIEMDQRYDLLKDAHVRNIKEYNTKFIARKLNPNEGHRYLPYIVVVVDEFADLMMTAGKEIETPIARLAQLARAIGIHLVIATQRPSVNVITGTIKANFPGRIAFRVSSKIDSRTILDSGGAEQLIGRGDMLLSNGSDLTRLQCAFVDTPEVEKITEYIGSQRGYASAHLLPEYVDETGEGSAAKDFNPDDRDALFEDAARLIVMHQQGSTSLIQRKLKLGYNRAGRIIDQLEASGIVGPFEGSKAREVLIKDEYSLEQHLNNLSNKE